MTKKLLLVFSFVFLFILSACQTGDNFYVNNGKLKIVTTLYPQYDFVKKIGQDKVDVKLLLKPGLESHSYEPTPSEIANISTKADLFVYTNEDMEPWAHDIIESVKNDSLLVVESSKGVTLIEGTHEEEEEHTEEEEEHGEYDPHVWLDPLNAIIMIDNILAALIQVDSKNQAFYEANAGSYKNEIRALHQDFENLFNQIPTDDRMIIHGGHFSFGYFAARYDVKYISPYEGFSPNAEPSPTKIAELVTLIRQLEQEYIYSEELVEPRVANVISSETGVGVLLLHGVHNVSSTEYENNVSYVSIMRQNLENLKKGFGIE